MSDPFAWSPRNLGPSREQRAAAAERRGLPRRGYTYVANDGLTDRQRRKSLAVQAQERRRQQREQRRQVRIGDREDDRARRRARRDAGEVGGAADNYRDAADAYGDAADAYGDTADNYREAADNYAKAGAMYAVIGVFLVAMFVGRGKAKW